MAKRSGDTQFESSPSCCGEVVEDGVENRFVPGLGLRLESEATFWGRNGFDRVVERNPALQAWSPVYKRGRRVNCQQQR